MLGNFGWDLGGNKGDLGAKRGRFEWFRWTYGAMRGFVGFGVFLQRLSISGWDLGQNGKDLVGWFEAKCRKYEVVWCVLGDLERF